MTEDWRSLLDAFLSDTIGAKAFHDRFLTLWRHDRDQGLPPGIDDLFFVVEAFTPDPALRDPSSPWEADECELRAAARSALGRLAGQGE